jgi:tape measure domain-containing protein
MSDRQITLKITPEVKARGISELHDDLLGVDRAAKTAAGDIDGLGTATKRAASQGRDELGRFAGGLSGASAKLGVEFGSISKIVDEVNGKIRGLTQFMGELGLAGQAIGGVASAISGVASSIADWADGQLRINDGLIMMRNQLRPVTDDVEALMNKTRALANRTLTDWGTTIDVYGRVSRSLQGLGLTESETLRLTETLSKSFATSGRSAQETSAAMLQLSQSLGSGVLQGDEFRSMAENAPQLLKAFADQLGVTRGELKKLSSEGKITTDVMIHGLENMKEAGDRAFAQLEKTQAMRDTGLRNALNADPLLFQKSVSLNTMSDLGSLKNLEEQLISAGRFLPGQQFSIEAILGVDTDTTAKVSDLNVELGKTVDALNSYKQALGGMPSKDNTPWGQLDDAPKHNFTGQMLDDLDQLGIKAPNAMKELQDSLKLLPIGEAIVKDLGGTFISLGDSIHDAALEANFLVSKLDGNALGGISTGLKGLIDREAEALKALKAWEDTRSDPARRSTGAKPKDAWADVIPRTGLDTATTAADSLAAMLGLGQHTLARKEFSVNDMLPSLQQIDATLESIKEHWSELDTEQSMWAQFTDQIGIAKGILERVAGIDPWDPDKLAREAEGVKITNEWNKELRDHELHIEHVNQAYEELQKRANPSLARLNTAWKDLNDGAAANLKTGIMEIGDMLGDAFDKGTLSGKKMVEALLHDFARMTIRSAFQFGGKALGLPGFASGGVISPGPATGGDNQIVAFRKNDRETVRIHTPEQEAAFQAVAARGQGGGSKQPVTINVPAGLSETELEHTIIRVVHERMPHLTSGLTGRPR